MSRITQLLKHVEQLNPQLAADLTREYTALSSRRAFGLNFERHTPETVELPGRPVRVNDKVRFLPARGEAPSTVGDRLWRVRSIALEESVKTATLVAAVEDVPPPPSADAELEVVSRNIDDLVVVAEFRDPIYPGLVSTGRVERGGDKPFHTVINAENYHALQTLQYTHEGRVDVIYIDPPYNTGAKDWKYNNDYVDGEDIYRHSKWLGFMERRLKVAQKLLNPENSVLIVTIDEKEYLRLGLLLEQTFPEARVQMVSSAINPKGSPRSNAFSRVDEYLYFVSIGSAAPARLTNDMLSQREVTEARVEWVGVRRRGSGWERSARPGLFYPVFVDPQTARIVDAGEPLPLGESRDTVADREGLLTVWPLNSRGDESRWQMTPTNLLQLARDGYVRTSIQATGGVTMDYLSSGQRRQIEDGLMRVTGRDENGAVMVEHPGARPQDAKTLWHQKSHDSTAFGSRLLSTMLPDRRFPFPKSLYAVEDALRFYVSSKPDAVIVDFFAGSGTTAHAVMRLNKQDGGRRQSISITNNEVSADEQRHLRTAGLRQGDDAWEKRGICDHITKPRISAAITGTTSTGEPIPGDYKFVDEFPLADGFEENAEFFTLTYENPRVVAHNRAYSAIAPLLWMRAGSQGARIDIEADDFAVTETYGVLFDVDASRAFLEELSLAPAARMAYIVTDNDGSFQMVCAALPEHIEPVRLYESYLTNFTINVGGENR